MEQLLLLILSTLLVWAVERSADALLDFFLEWLKNR